MGERTKLSDDDKMPWGKYAGQRLGEVPDSYLRWFLQQDWSSNYPDLVEYSQLIEEGDK